MLIRPSKIDDSQHILNLLINSYSQNRYTKNYAPNWINCFITNPFIFPSFVASDENGIILGYIVWRIRQLSDDHQMTIELQELTAQNDPQKPKIERTLFDESPKQIINSITNHGFNIGGKCNLDIWIHHEDHINDQSIFSYEQYDQKYGEFLGIYEKSDARGGYLSLYRQVYTPK